MAKDTLLPWMQQRVDCVTVADAFGMSPLHFATQYGHAGCVGALLARGADVNAHMWVNIEHKYLTITMGLMPLHSAQRCS